MLHVRLTNQISNSLSMPFQQEEKEIKNIQLKLQQMVYLKSRKQLIQQL